jgi:hypothetical protein
LLGPAILDQSGLAPECRFLLCKPEVTGSIPVRSIEEVAAF